MTHSGWTEDRIDELKRRWDAGESCSEIGRAIGVTRNAVIGKVHRLKLKARGSTVSMEQREQRRLIHDAARVERQRNQRRRVRGTKMQEPPVTPPPPFIGSLNIPFADLRPWLSGGTNQCRFIAAENPGPDYLACGNETLPGESYCGHCKDIVFRRVPVATLVPEKVAA